MDWLLFPAALFALIALIEALSWALGTIGGVLMGRPPPRRRELLAEQGRMLDLLIHDRESREVLHPVLGWALRAGYSRGQETINCQGLRGVREYGCVPSEGVRRIAAFGDSFIFGNEVSDSAAWSTRIEQGWEAEVLNFGVGGYGLDQALLRHACCGARFAPHDVVIGLTACMASRVVSRYRRFEVERDGPWFKPRFVLEGGGLRLVPTPVGCRGGARRLLEDPLRVTRAGEHDFWFVPAVYSGRLYPYSATYRALAYSSRVWWKRHLHPRRTHRRGMLNPQSEAFEIIRRLLLAFVDAVRAHGARPLVLLIPSRRDLRRHFRRGTTQYRPLASAVEGGDFDVLDLAPPIARATDPRSLGELFAPDGHYSEAGNRLMADAVAEALELPRRGTPPPNAAPPTSATRPGPRWPSACVRAPSATRLHSR